MFEEIKRLLIECANDDDKNIAPSAKLKDDLGIDSLYAVELILELETSFEIQMTWEDIQDLKTVQDVVDLLEAKLKEKK